MPVASSKFGHGLGRLLTQVLVESVYFTKRVEPQGVVAAGCAPPTNITVLLTGFHCPLSANSKREPPSGGRITAPVLYPVVVNCAHVPGAIEEARFAIALPPLPEGSVVAEAPADCEEVFPAASYAATVYV